MGRNADVGISARSSSSSAATSPIPRSCTINGNHWAQRQAEKAGIAFTPLDNAFADVADVPPLHAICDSLGEQQIRALLIKWLRALPYPFTDHATDARDWYDVSTVQPELS